MSNEMQQYAVYILFYCNISIDIVTDIAVK